VPDGTRLGEARTINPHQGGSLGPEQSRGPKARIPTPPAAAVMPSRTRTAAPAMTEEAALQVSS